MTPTAHAAALSGTLPAGVLNANQQVGSAAGVAALGTVFVTLFETVNRLAAMQTVLGRTIGLVLVSAVLAAALPRRAREEEAAA
jgi:hypothetical protein